MNTSSWSNYMSDCFVETDEQKILKKLEWIEEQIQDIKDFKYQPMYPDWRYFNPYPIPYPCDELPWYRYGMYPCAMQVSDCVST